MLDGTVSRGTLDAELDNAGIAIVGGTDATRPGEVTFEPANGDARRPLPFNKVRAIYLQPDSEPEPHASLRFFDDAPVPKSLWVRLTFVDGEVMEGMVKNHFSAFSAPLISLRIPQPSAEQVPVLVPRCVVAEFQVIATR
jgi:hypothetical protein